jgi:DnaJ-class molecular chaperone
MSQPSESTGVFSRKVCPQCHGTGELRIESENVNENFEVEKQVIIMQCPQCNGTGALVGAAASQG